MASITENLKKILAAVYGRDVRQAIHDGIAGCGLSWKTKPEEKEKMLVFLEEEKLKWEAMYELELY